MSDQSYFCQSWPMGLNLRPGRAPQLIISRFGHKCSKRYELTQNSRRAAYV